MSEICKIKYIKKLFKEKKISCYELTQKYLDAIFKYDKDINSYIEITKEYALKKALEVDKKVSNNEELMPLEGIPMSLKDNISTKDIKTTCCSKVLKDYVPTYDATVSDILKKQNSILLGKNNMDEFAMGCACETSCFGRTNNPHNVDYVPGGSSGGGTAAVAANLAVFSLGSDTGGSIRQPASFCGIVGLKPTYGSISRYGLISLGSSLDQIGPMASSVEDVSLVYDELSLKDVKDATCFGKVNKSTHSSLNNSLKGIKIGLPKQYFEDVNDEVKVCVEKAIKVYESLGAKLIPLGMPDIKYSLPIYYILVCSEAASNFARFDGIRYGYNSKIYKGVDDFYCKTREESFGEDVKRRILLGNYFLSGNNYSKYYERALKIRNSILNTFDEAFKKCDVILSSTVPQTAFKHGFKPDDQMEAYMSDICTVPVNIAGNCAVSIPCGFDRNNMPIGMQIIGDRFCEYKILNVAYKFEQETCCENIRNLSMGVTL